MFLMLITGLLLFDPIGLPWSLERWALVVHIVAAITLVPSLLVPFWWAHRGALNKRRRSRFHAATGRIIEGLLIVLIGSGAWLTFIGDNGTFDGAFAHWSHLVLAGPLILLAAAHAWRYSGLRQLMFLVALAASGVTAFPNASVEAPAPKAVESRPLLLAGDALYSANGDGGSVSKIDRRTGARLAEARLGGDIRTVALDPSNGVVAATDYKGGALDLLDAVSLSMKRRVAVDGRPYGVVYDQRNQIFWTTATESGRLFGVSEDGSIRSEVKTEETPRGLALLPDGRLLVTLAMTGKIAIYDTKTLPPRLVKTITLASERNQDQTVSQGLPRVLDRIVVSPDLKQAWLPHELWNFTHPFQFQTTVFPAISVLILTPGDEREAVSQRKQLFKQINILEDGNRTRIVSNPADAAFTSDGSKVYATMSGSEDLVAFDLSRAPPVDSKIAGNLGAKAVQIFRHLPGEDPRGIVVAGDDVYVQNAMSLDLTRLTRGGEGPFARVSVVAPRFASLVGEDPLPAGERRGERLFDLGDTAAFPATPMAGDNWMSCSSCHVDGFNFTNRYLFQDTPVDKFHSAVTGHDNLKTLVAGDFIGDYIRMIQGTQGGMGADTRFPTPKTDPDHPSAGAAAPMRDLHAFVVSPGNLPLLSTWLHGENETGAVDPSNWVKSAACAACHETIFKDWANSMHHLMGQSNPYYEVMEDLAAQSEGPAFRNYCMGCHSPQALLSGERETRGPSHLFDKDGAALLADKDGTGLLANLRDYVGGLDEGAACVACHRADKIANAGATAGANASFSISLANRPLYPGETSDWAILRWFGEREIRAKPAAHAKSLMPAAVSDPRLCSTCHEEFAPGTGAYILDTYTEWAKSAFNAPNDPAKNRTCMDCHMHADVSQTGTPIPGRATDGGPLEQNVFTHGFVGGQYQLVGLRDPKLGAMSVNLLKSAARLDVRQKGPGRLVVRVTNIHAGHTLPTGLASFRQMWLQVTVVDAHGGALLSSGSLDSQGRLDPGARLFHEALGDKDGHDVGLEFWRYGRMLADTRIPAGGFRDETFDVPESAAYPLKVDVRLMFRTYPEWITALVRKRFPDLPPPQPVVMATLQRTVEHP